MNLPDGLRATDDVVCTIVAVRALVHRLVPAVTACGQPLWAMHKVSAGHMATLSCRWCPTCWPQSATSAASGWAQMLALAHLPFPDVKAQRGFGFLNSHARPGVGQPTKGYR